MWLYHSLILASIVISCNGLSCYDCASKDDLRCLDNFDESDQDYIGSGDCDAKATHCVKYKTVTFLQDSGFITGKERELTVVTRTCIIMKGHSDGCIAVEGDGGFYFRCLCSTDNCNSGRTIPPSVILVGLMALLTLVLNLRR